MRAISPNVESKMLDIIVEEKILHAHLLLLVPVSGFKSKNGQLLLSKYAFA